MEEKIDTRKKTIIDSVPGIPARPDSAEDSTVTAGDFGGDPRKVIGHPDNPFSKIDTDEITALFNNESRDLGSTVVGNTVEITEVPKSS